jgi:FtsP/CotA-like multicopper oxidase with cupredoxin domain
MINAANARIFALLFERQRPWVIALDGNPLAQPVQLGEKELLFIAPGQRADLIIDIQGSEDWRIIDRFSRRRAYEVVALTVSSAANTRRASRDAPAAMAPNPHSEPSATNNRSEAIQLGGGAGRNPVNPPSESTAQRASRLAARLNGKPSPRPVWSVNGFAHTAHGADHPYEFEAFLGETIYLTFENRTNWWHPMHLHGHSFKELMRDGKPVAGQPWRDTSLLAPRTNLTVAFVADNPGNWLIHCHVLEHHAGGMGTQFKVGS